MRGGQKAQPFGHPLDGRVRRQAPGPRTDEGQNLRRLCRVGVGVGVFSCWHRHWVAYKVILRRSCSGTRSCRIGKPSAVAVPNDRS
jgi:hypothetical protein